MLTRRTLATATVLTSLLLMTAGAAAAAAGAPATRPAGVSTATWPLPDDAELERVYASLGARYGFKIPAKYPQKKRDEWLPKTGGSQPTYDLYVPPGYRPDRPHGLFVWISADADAGVPREDWRRVLDAHRLIWVGPSHAGNDTDPLLRAYLALEAVRHAKREFNVDPARVYVGGFSGGGRVASHAAFVAADTFAGGMFVCGSDFFRDVPEIPGAKHGKYYRGFARKPDPKLLARAKKNRFVLLTGSDDFNRVNTLAVHDGYLTSKFPHVALLNVPNLGHEPPDPEWFEKGVQFLAAPPPTTDQAGSRPATAPATRPSRGTIRMGPGQKPVR